MRAVVGVVRDPSNVPRILTALEDARVASSRITVLSPDASEAAVRRLPATDAEQPGIAKTIGSVVGGAAGSAGALAVASVVLPGLGPVLAAGALAAGLVGGAATGHVVGSQLDNALSHGLPTDELYVYRDALRKGRSLIVVTAEDDEEAARVRESFQALGVESVDAAREEWWVGLRDAEEAEYVRQGGDFRKDEALFRQGFDAANRERTLARDVAELRERHGAAADNDAFRAGYERGRAHRETWEATLF